MAERNNCPNLRIMKNLEDHGSGIDFPTQKKELYIWYGGRLILYRTDSCIEDIRGSSQENQCRRLTTMQ